MNGEVNQIRLENVARKMELNVEDEELGSMELWMIAKKTTSGVWNSIIDDSIKIKTA